MVRINICMYCMYIYIYIYTYTYIYTYRYIYVYVHLFSYSIYAWVWLNPWTEHPGHPKNHQGMGYAEAFQWLSELLEVRHLWDLYNVLIICRWSFTPIEPASNKLPKQCGYGHLWNPSLVREARLWVAEISGLRCRPRGKARQSPSLGACRGDHCCFRSFLYVHIIHVRDISTINISWVKSSYYPFSIHNSGILCVLSGRTFWTAQWLSAGRKLDTPWRPRPIIR